MQCGALPNLFESALYCIKGVWSTTTNVYLYFSACKFRSKGKGDRREPIPLLIYSISKIMSVDNGVFEQCRQMYLFTMGKNTGVALATFAYDV